MPVAETPPPLQAHGHAHARQHSQVLTNHTNMAIAVNTDGQAPGSCVAITRDKNMYSTPSPVIRFMAAVDVLSNMAGNWRRNATSATLYCTTAAHTGEYGHVGSDTPEGAAPAGTE